MPTELFRYAEIPLQNKCRYFVKRGTIPFPLSHGFRSKAEANVWIESLGHRLDWRAGYIFRLRGDSVDMEIVDRDGIRAT